jgi:hypothetical protein
VSTKKDEETEELLEDLVDAAAKAKLLRVQTEAGSIGLSSASSVDIQPSNSLFGLRLTKKQDVVVPMLLFDTKKLRPPHQFDGAQNAVDEALNNYDKSYEAPS